MAINYYFAKFNNEFAIGVIFWFKMRVEAIATVAAMTPQQQRAAEPLHGIRAWVYFEEGVDGDVPAAGYAQRLQGIGKAWLFHMDDGARRAR